LNVFFAIIHISKFLLMLLLKNPKLVYLGISQGIWGYLRDLGFLLPAAILKKRIVIHVRGSEFRSFYNNMPTLLRIITKALFKRITRVIILGESLVPMVLGLVSKEVIDVVPNGINYEQFDENGLSREEVGTTGKNVLYLSSLMERKGILRLIEAAPLILMEYPETNFMIAGKWQSEKDKKKAFELISSNNLDGRVVFLGEVSGQAKTNLYRESDVFVFPPIEPEGMPWVLLEAMSARLPVITTNQGTIPEVVEDGKSGFIIEPTPEHLSDKISMLIQNPSLAKEMGENGRRRVEKWFNEDIYLKRMKEVFEKSLESES
jgi:glycosyltransferase involved in cell wall biosynthesis